MIKKNCKNKMLENKANNADFFSKSVLGTNMCKIYLDFHIWYKFSSIFLFKLKNSQQKGRVWIKNEGQGKGGGEVKRLIMQNGTSPPSPYSCLDINYNNLNLNYTWVSSYFFSCQRINKVQSVFPKCLNLIFE